MFKFYAIMIGLGVLLVLIFGGFDSEREPAICTEVRSKLSQGQFVNEGEYLAWQEEC